MLWEVCKSENSRKTVQCYHTEPLAKHFPNRQLSCSASRLRVWTPQSRQLILKQVKEGLHCHAGIQVSFLIGWKKQAVIASLLNTRLHKLTLRPKRQQLYCISFCINDLNLFSCSNKSISFNHHRTGQLSDIPHLPLSIFKTGFAHYCGAAGYAGGFSHLHAVTFQPIAEMRLTLCTTNEVLIKPSSRCHRWHPIQHPP